MTISDQINNHSSYIDGQLVQLAGPHNVSLTYQYEAHQRAFYIREALITTSAHGSTHVSTDLVPSASCDSPGLMAADDKCKLDALVGTRLGVLGFMGAGFPDDGGFMQGDIILAAGSEFISLERVGNVVRFVVDIPTPFTCTSEECFQVYWIQDETDTNAIRPPSCGGKLPGVNAYGELKVYIFPESTIINPSKTTTTLNQKGTHPSLIFKRYDDGLGVDDAEFDLVLSRNSSGTAKVGWAFTPGATGTAECVWFMGTDTDGNRIEFELIPNSEPGLVGAMFYKGISITKQIAVITGYESDVLLTNRYKAKWWSLTDQASVGSEFVVTNIQQWDLTTNSKVLDSTLDSVLSMGQFIDVWTIPCGSGSCYYSQESANLNVSGLWTTIGAVEFGDTIVARPETDTNPTSTDDVNDGSLIDPHQWGMTNFEDPLVLFVPDGSNPDTILPASGQANYSVSIVNTTSGDTTPDRRYLEIVDDSNSNNIQRPVHIWHRTELRNALIDIYLAKPVETAVESASGCQFPPIDVLLRAPISVVDTKYGTITDIGSFSTGVSYAGFNWVKTTGLHWHDLPTRGAIKVLICDGSYTYGQVMSYTAKVVDTNGAIYLVTSDTVPSIGTVFELLHEEYTTPAVRLQFAHNVNGHSVEMKPIVGTLDMSTPSDLDAAGATDNFVKGFSSSTEGTTYWQIGDAETSATGIQTNVDGFYVLNGGVSSGIDYYNTLRIMVIENKVWMWWNGLLISPVLMAGSGSSSESLPYFTISDVVKYGKFGLRLWPGARVRRMVVRSKLFQFSEFSLGQLDLS